MQMILPAGHHVWEILMGRIFQVVWKQAETVMDKVNYLEAMEIHRNNNVTKVLN